MVAPALIGPGAAISYYLYDSMPAVIAVQVSIIAAYVFQYAVNPDLDLLENSIGSKLLSTWTPAGWYRRSIGRVSWPFVHLFTKLFWLYWWPYAKLIPHRHALSHLPILGTSLRLAYVFLPFLILWSGWKDYFASLPFLVFCFSVGILDALHWVADGFPMHSIRERL